MVSRLCCFLLAASFSASASDALGAVLAIPETLGASASSGARPGAGFSLLPAPSGVLGLALPSALPLTPTLAAKPIISLNAAVSVAASPGRGVPHAAVRVRLIRDFGSRILGNRRDVAVYLPPGYDEENARYPVLYMQDGQNAFDPATAYAGIDWGLAQTCDRLIAAGEMAPVIIVAVYNTPARLDEYTPVAADGYGGGNGDAYGRFLSDELKPLIDADFRTRPEAEQTAVMGASLGGLISLHLALTRPDVFSRAAALSPSLWWAEGRMARWTRRASLPKPRPRLWVDMGTEEGDGSEARTLNLESLRAFSAVLRRRGWQTGAGLEVREVEGAAHNERSWGARAAEVLKFLFPPAPPR